MRKGSDNLLAYSANFWLSKESAEKCLEEVYTSEQWQSKFHIVPLVLR